MLVNDAFMHLVDADAVNWQSRGHFYALASRVMRRILVDRARARRRNKRGGDLVRTEFEDERVISPESDVDVPDPRELSKKTFKDAKEQWLTSFERDYIATLLRKNKGNISHAAREADIDRKYFRKLMKKYEIAADEYS